MKLIHGDCLQVLKTLPENFVESVVTDPPYELSNDGKQSSARVFFEFAFPKNSKIEPHLGSSDCLPDFITEVLRLGVVRGVPCPSTSVPVVSVALDNDSSVWDDNIENNAESSIGVSANTARGNIESKAGKHLGCFALKLADPTKFLQVLNQVGSGFVPGGVGVGFRVGSAGGPGSLAGLRSIVSVFDIVRSGNDSFSNLVSAMAGATSDPVFCFNLGLGSVEQFTANAARLFFAILYLAGAELVRADSAASGLPPMFEARRISVVDDSANGAFAFDLIVHEQTVSGSGFMGKRWDGSKITYNVELWREILRVLKPGGHLLAFGGSRTYHRMACAIEDAGFEVRDQIMWVYGSGFPKSLDVSKALDKMAGAEREFTPLGNAVKRMVPGADQNVTGSWIKDSEREYQPGVSQPTTDAARSWQGWGTSLKPAHEPICVARKPLIGTTIQNVLAHGTGALNIDGCRVGSEIVQSRVNMAIRGGKFAAGDSCGLSQDVTEHAGRWPANFIHDGSDEVLAGFPVTSSGSRSAGVRRGLGSDRTFTRNVKGDGGPEIVGSTGSAARFFYCAKASRTDRNEGLDDPGPQFTHGATLRKIENADRKGNHHPTVKPTDLMRYLCRLVTPPGGVVLDPFMGSGSTGKAALLEGFDFFGIELEADYLEIAQARINCALRSSNEPAISGQINLFGASA